jgi:Tfp pilus assembly protein PilN
LRGEISRTDEFINQKKEELASSDTQKLENSVVQLNNQIKGVQTLQANNYRWSEVLMELTLITPDEVHLSTVTLTRANDKIEVAGVADTRDAAIQFWANVKKSKYFRNINFPFTNLERETNSNFTYTFYLNSNLIKNEVPD